MDAYTDKATGEISPQFNQAVAMYVWAWFILTVIYTIAAMRSSWILFLDLFFLDIDLMLLACGYMLEMPSLLTAGNSVGFIVAFLSCKFGVLSAPMDYLLKAPLRLGWLCRPVLRRPHTLQCPYLCDVQREEITATSFKRTHRSSMEAQ